MHPVPDENPTRGTHVIEQDGWRAVEGDLAPNDITGTGSLLAMSHYQFMHSPPEFPPWTWMCGPGGYRPEMGVQFVYAGGPCTSTNRSCHCHFCQSPTINGHCVCPQHNPEEAA